MLTVTLPYTRLHSDMLCEITELTIQQQTNAALRKYAQQYLAIEANTIAAIEALGLPFHKEPDAQQKKQHYLQQLHDKGAQFSNTDKSIFINWRSSACQACETGLNSMTTFISLKCHRDCFFCFNPNQEHYEYYCAQQRDATTEFEQLPSEQRASLTHIALTGGEPLLFKQQSIQFFQKVQDLAPHIHTRLYTASDAFSQQTAERLCEAGLQEIRFSIKTDDSPEKLEKQLQKISIARQYLPTVMVEMPVLPDTLATMKDLLLRLGAIGIDGINLLEFCFPFNNVEIFQQRGYTLKYPPYEVYYNYWYAGGLAIHGSGLSCLELLLFALDNNLKMGVHYCSLENKFTGQLYQQNIGFTHPLYEFSPRDYFLKTAKVFYSDRVAAESLLKEKQIPYETSLEHGYLQIHPEHIPLFAQTDAQICLSFNVIELASAHERLIKEVKLFSVTPK